MPCGCGVWVTRSGAEGVQLDAPGLREGLQFATAVLRGVLDDLEAVAKDQALLL